MTIDDILDYDIDALVERTQTRAIPRGAISVDRAWLFFALQVVIGVTLAFKLLTPTRYVSSPFQLTPSPRLIPNSQSSHLNVRMAVVCDLPNMQGIFV